MTDRSPPTDQSDEAPPGDAASDGTVSSEAGSGLERDADALSTADPSDGPGQEAVESVDGEDDESDDSPSLAGIFGGNPGDAPKRTEIAPGTPSLENALFVTLGVLFSVFVVYRVLTLFTA